MGFRYQRRTRTGRNSWLNVSKRGVSGSIRMGPVTFNSRGRSSVRVGKGMAYRSGCALPMTVVALSVVGGSMSVAARRVHHGSR